MRSKPVDNFTLEHWRGLASCAVLEAFADHAKQDKSFLPRERLDATRWHVAVGGAEFELLCTGVKFFDMRTGHGGGGAIDLVMYLFGVDFKHAVALLRDRRL